MRYAFANTLLELARNNGDIMLLTADLGYTVFEDFRSALPDQFQNVGVAESNMISLASGMALTGKTVFVYTIASFALAVAYQKVLIDIASHNLPVVIVGTGAGLSYSEASVTHHALNDIALALSVPGMTVFAPGDPVEAAWATRTAATLNSPVYLRLGKKGEPVLYHSHAGLKPGKASILSRGSDVLLLSAGNMTAAAVETAGLLGKQRISVTVASVHTLRPLDAGQIIRLAAKHPLVVTVEEHYETGGLGSVIGDVLVRMKEHPPLLRIAVPDRFVRTIGSHAYLRSTLKLTPAAIAHTVRKHLQ